MGRAKGRDCRSNTPSTQVALRRTRDDFRNDTRPIRGERPIPLVGRAVHTLRVSFAPTDDSESDRVAVRKTGTAMLKPFRILTA